MGKIVLPKHSSNEKHFAAALKIYYDKKGWVENKDFVDSLKKVIGDEEYSSSYNKKAQLLKYYEFVIAESTTGRSPRQKITSLGKLLHRALENKDQTAINNAFMVSMENIQFGRNNFGSPSSNSDIENPNVAMHAIKDLDYITYLELAFILQNLNERTLDYKNCLAEIKTGRTTGSLEFSDVNRYSDNKPIMLLANLSILTVDEENSQRAAKAITFSSLFKEEYLNDISDLKMCNENKNYFGIIGEDEESTSNKENDEQPFTSDFPRNRIIFGAPGTGKSYTFNKESVGHKDYPNEEYLLKNGGEYERVTFHPDYSYAQFVGTYKPTTKKSESPSISEDSKKVLDILKDSKKSSQEKYNLLFDSFKDNDITRLPVLLGLYTDEPFKTRKKDGTDTVGNNSVERNHGRAIRPYVNLNLDEQFDDLISYEYVPGPFMRILVKALKNKESDNIKPHLLLIEEINRANVAAVFGDVFQLLDRDDSNQSEYPIQTSEDMKKYLVKELGGATSDYAQIRIPDNIFIWATMNSADQGVFSMDTAFKRRWDFTYQGINEGEKDIESYNYEMGGSPISVNWNELRKAINAELITYNINEDKLIGAHFVKKESLKNKEIFDKTFKSKVIMYLLDDAAKQKRPSLFSGVESPKSFKLYSDICDAYDEIGIGIFSETIKKKFDNNINTNIDIKVI